MQKYYFLLLPVLLFITSCGERAFPPSEVFIKQGDRVIRVEAEPVQLSPAPFTLMVTIAQQDTSQPYGIALWATHEKVTSFMLDNAVSLPFSPVDTLFPAQGMLPVDTPVVAHYRYLRNGKGNFSKTEEKLGQLLMELTFSAMNNEPVSAFQDYQMKVWLAPLYREMPLQPQIITLTFEE